MMVGSIVLVSVVIPAYNAEAFISRAIESALSQTFPPAEIVVVDDGSSDHTAEVAERYDSRVRVIRQANAGPASARNTGIRQSKSDWIALLDADDSWLPQKLERQVRAIEPGVGLVHSRAVGRRIDVPAQITFKELWSRNCISTSSVLLFRQAFNSVGGFDENRALIGSEDYDLWLRIAAEGWKICGVPEELFVYAPAANSLSSQLLRVSRAEITSAKRIATVLGLSRDELLRKELAVLEQLGRDLVSLRQTKQARAAFAEALQRKVNMRRACWWLATWLPVSVLNWRRRLLHEQYGSTKESGGDPGRH